MRKLLTQLPSDAVEQSMPRFRLTRRRANPSSNGYVNYVFITAWAKEDNSWPCASGCSGCRSRGRRAWARPPCSAASWFLDTMINTLLDALGHFFKQQGLREKDTFSWGCATT